MNPRLRLGSIFFILSSDFFLHILKSYSDIVQYLLEYPQLFQDIQNFQDIQLGDIGRFPKALEYP